jgi:hypothetical protein
MQHGQRHSSSSPRQPPGTQSLGAVSKQVIEGEEERVAIGAAHGSSWPVSLMKPTVWDVC